MALAPESSEKGRRHQLFTVGGHNPELFGTEASRPKTSEDVSGRLQERPNVPKKMYVLGSLDVSRGKVVVARSLTCIGCVVCSYLKVEVPSEDRC